MVDIVMGGNINKHNHHIAEHIKDIFWDNESEEYVVIFTEYPLLSAFGKTKKEALEDAKKVFGMIDV